MKIKDVDLGEYPIILAPMEDVTDPPFRTLCREWGADMSYSEFISADGLIRNAAKSLVKLDIEDSERPVGIQIFGANADSMREATQMIASLGGEYLKLNTTYGAASFDINEHNRELLSFLKSNRHFVSEFKERDNQFKVSFLHSC